MDHTSGISDRAAGAFAAVPQQGPVKRLILMRHGHPEKPEDLRAEVGHSFQELQGAFPGLIIDAMLYSPFKRTVRTAGECYRVYTADKDFKKPGLALPFIRQGWLGENAGAKLGYSGLLQNARELDDSWNTVLLVTHSTVAPLLAKVLKAPATDKELVFTMSDYASVLVLDIPSDRWSDAGLTPSRISKVILQSQTLDAPRLKAATDDFMQSLRTTPSPPVIDKDPS